MKSQNEMNALQRVLTVLGASGTAALMALPVLAQSSPLNPNPSIFNEAPYNRSGQTTDSQINSTDSQINSTPVVPSGSSSSVQSDRCAAYTRGGIGGPIDSQSNQPGNVSPSAQSGLSTPNSNVNQFPSRANIGGQLDQSVIGSTTATTQAGAQANNNQAYSNNQSMMQSNRTQASAPFTRQFDGNNPSAALAFRNNGPAGTAGKEAAMNLSAYSERTQNSMMSSNQSTSLSQAPIPVECLPR